MITSQTKGESKSEERKEKQEHVCALKRFCRGGVCFDVRSETVVYVEIKFLVSVDKGFVGNETEEAWGDVFMSYEITLKQSSRPDSQRPLSNPRAVLLKQELESISLSLKP